jgi:hypothetical protein
MKLKVCSLIIIFVFLLSIAYVVAAGEKIPWWSVNGGGNIYSSSTNYKLCGSAGQSVAGEAVGTYHSYSGFWNLWVVATDVEEEKEEAAIPKEFSLSQNYPNPFNPQTVIEYALPKESQVSVTVYNILGQRVKVLKDEFEKEGYKRVVWDGRDDSGEEVASGIYFYRIVTKDFVTAKKMMMVK